MNAATCKSYRMAEARINLKTIMAEVTATGKWIKVGKKGAPKVVVMPEEDNLLAVSFEYAMARMITEKLFSEAPLHLKRPQTAELSKLTLRQLALITQINSFPILQSLRDQIVAELGSEEVVTRMEKRERIASAILNAEREGLYEAAEHATGMLSPCDE